MRLIDADALKLTKINLEDGCSIVDMALAVIKCVNDAPTINPADLVPQGLWEFDAYDYEWNCSECHNWMEGGDVDESVLPNFCPNCGARMVTDYAQE